MKKSILAIAVAATMAAPAAMAAPTVYGNVHVSINDLDNDVNGPDMTSNTSALGVKGSEDLGNGLKAIYKMEFQVDVADSGAITGRDQFVGLKGGFGTVKFGAMSSNYKQMGGKVDSLYRTRAEGRGLIHTQSRLHNGRADNRGRMTNLLQYASPKMGGIQLVANTTFNDNVDESVGVGVRYSTKAITAYVDFLDTVPGGDSASANATESAVKVGGKFSTKAFHAALQYEAAEDLTGYDYIHLNAGFNIDKNNSIQVTYGVASFVGASANDTTGLALAYNHNLSKMTNVYVAYIDKSVDDVATATAAAAVENSGLSFGIRKKF